MGQLDSLIFGKKTFSDILEEIYQNQKKRDGIFGDSARGQADLGSAAA